MSQKRIISTDRAPAAIGAYNQAVVAAGFVHCSGQIALDPASGELIEGDVQAQTRQVMENLAAVLKAAGTDFTQAIKCTVFLKDLGDFGAVNEVYGSYFEPEAAPARACVEVSRLPRDVMVEVDCIALVP